MFSKNFAGKRTKMNHKRATKIAENQHNLRISKSGCRKMFAPASSNPKGADDDRVWPSFETCTVGINVDVTVVRSTSACPPVGLGYKVVTTSGRRPTNECTNVRVNPHTAAPYTRRQSPTRPVDSGKRTEPNSAWRTRERRTEPYSACDVRQRIMWVTHRVRNWPRRKRVGDAWSICVAYRVPDWTSQIRLVTMVTHPSVRTRRVDTSTEPVRTFGD